MNCQATGQGDEGVRHTWPVVVHAGQAGRAQDRAGSEHRQAIAADQAQRCEHRGSTQQLRQTGIVNHVGERQKVHQPGNAENPLVVIEVAAHAIPQSGHQSESVGDDEGREQEHREAHCE